MARRSRSWAAPPSQLRAPFVLPLLLGLLLVAAPARVRADDGAEGRGDLWYFTDGEQERVVDVGSMPDFVRRALVERLEGQGFRRVPDGGARGPGRDLEVDARELVRHRGRFPDRARPPGARPGPSLLRRALRALAVRPPRLLGAVVGRGGPGWRLAAVAPRTVAAAVGLRAGDEILRVGGSPPTREGIQAWAAAPAGGGKLCLRVRRRESRSPMAREFEFELALEIHFVPAGD